MWWSGSVRVKPSISGNLRGVLVFLAIELGWRGGKGLYSMYCDGNLGGVDVLKDGF